MVKFVLIEKKRKEITPRVINSSQMTQDCLGLKTTSPMSQKPCQSQANQRSRSPCPLSPCVTWRQVELQLESAHLTICCIISDIHHQIINSHCEKKSRNVHSGLHGASEAEALRFLYFQVPSFDFTILRGCCPKLYKLHHNYVICSNDGDDGDDETVVPGINLMLAKRRDRRVNPDKNFLSGYCDCVMV